MSHQNFATFSLSCRSRCGLNPGNSNLCRPPHVNLHSGGDNSGLRVSGSGRSRFRVQGLGFSRILGIFRIFASAVPGVHNRGSKP